MSKTKQILWHVLTITVFVLIELYVVFIYGSNATFWDYFSFYLFELTFFYFTSLIILPKVYSNKLNTFTILIILIAWILAISILNILLYTVLYKIHKASVPQIHFKIIIIKTIVRQIYIFSLSLAFWYARKAIQKEKESKVKEVALAFERVENARLELALTRSQMDPHLMVNALSSVQGILMEKAPDAVKIIYSLTEIHSNILEMTSSNYKNTLSNELRVMHEVVTLFKELGKEPFYLVESIEKYLLELPFPPHVIIGIVENVFKHADFNAPAPLPLIRIHGKGDQLNILVKNKVHPGIKKTQREGLGLHNIRKSLDIAYPHNYQWKESTEQGSYELSLTIKLYEKI